MYTILYIAKCGVLAKIQLNPTRQVIQWGHSLHTQLPLPKKLVLYEGPRTIMAYLIQKCNKIFGIPYNSNCVLYQKVFCICGLYRPLWVLDSLPILGSLIYQYILHTNIIGTNKVFSTFQQNQTKRYEIDIARGIRCKNTRDVQAYCTNV